MFRLYIIAGVTVSGPLRRTAEVRSRTETRVLKRHVTHNDQAQVLKRLLHRFSRSYAPMDFTSARLQASSAIGMGYVILTVI